jgi:general secretion pathway protein C
MLRTNQGRFVIHLTTLFLWIALFGSVTYWMLRIIAVTPPSENIDKAVRNAEVTDPSNFIRMLGTSSSKVIPSAEALNRFALKGVISGRAGAEAALIVVDNDPARTFLVGAPVADGFILHSTTKNEVKLSKLSGGLSFMTLQMPPTEK